MLDPKSIRSEADALASKLLKKKFTLDTAWIAKLDSQRKVLQLATEALQNERNSRSKMIGKAKAAGEDITEILNSMEGMKAELEQKKEQLADLQSKLHEYLAGVPNIPDDAVPEGDDEAANQLISTWGEPKTYDFEIQDHASLGEALQQGLRIQSGDQQLDKTRLIEKRHALTAGRVFGTDGVMPVGPPEGVIVHGRFTVSRKPVDSFPARLTAKTSSARFQAVE
jgi:seryl-tRNA synthetase